MENKEWITEGNVWKVGDNVNNESISPTKYLYAQESGKKATLMEHIAEVLIPDFSQKMGKGDIWVAGKNLGCSSSRNTPLFLKDKGISCILCHSASTIFYRNGLNSGIPIFEIGEDVEKINMNDRVRVNVKTGEIKNLTTGEKVKAKVFPDFIMAILGAGSIKQRILSRKSEYKLLK